MTSGRANASRVKRSEKRMVVIFEMKVMYERKRVVQESVVGAKSTIHGQGEKLMRKARTRHTT